MTEQAADRQGSLSLFISYARDDERYLDLLLKHLSPLRRLGLIEPWDDRAINPGGIWEEEVDKHLRIADIIILLISSNFFVSSHLNEELQKALERRKFDKVPIIPIILRHVDWLSTPLGQFQALPRDGRPVSSYVDVDEAFFEIAQYIARTCQDILRQRQYLASGNNLETRESARKHVEDFLTYREELVFRGDVRNQVPRMVIHRLSNVFVKSSFPEITFVQRDDFIFLKLALEQAGRGVVIEGPSGAGKTTAVEKAVEDLKKLKNGPPVPIQRFLTARNPEHRAQLQTLRQWHAGIVIIDDFHRLDSATRQEIVDYLKELADTSERTKKIVIVGIPRTGQALVDLASDLATRLDIFRFGRVSDDLIAQVIEKGERALNITFDRKTEIVLAASGSFNLAQFLCFNVCVLAGIEETQGRQTLVRSDTLLAIKTVLNELKTKFSKSITHFTAMGEARDVTCLRLLEELAMVEDGFISLPSLALNKPELARGIKRFVDEHWMEKLYQACPEAEDHFFFDQVRQALVIDDPQLAFYLRKIPFSSLAREAGKIETLAQRKVFISYSHKDADWLQRLRTQLRPIERDGIIDLWDDTKIAAGLQWKEEIRNALETARVAVLLVSANFLASDFIAEHELPTLLAHAEKGGTTIIPLILSPCLYTSTTLGRFQAINNPKHPLAALSRIKQEEILVRVAETIAERFQAE